MLKILFEKYVSANAYDKKGSSLVELVMVMMLLALFGVSAYTLIFAGINTHKDIEGNKKLQTDARIAVSYLNVLLRRNDSDGSISIQTISQTGQDALVIYETGKDGAKTATWIYYIDGYIAEYLTYADDKEPLIELGLPIAPVMDFTIIYDKERNSVTNTVVYEYGGEEKTIASTLYLKSKVRL